MACQWPKRRPPEGQITSAVGAAPKPPRPSRGSLRSLLSGFPAAHARSRSAASPFDGSPGSERARASVSQEGAGSCLSVGIGVVGTVRAQVCGGRGQVCTPAEFICLTC